MILLALYGIMYLANPKRKSEGTGPIVPDPWWHVHDCRKCREAFECECGLLEGVIPDFCPSCRTTLGVWK